MKTDKNYYKERMEFIRSELQKARDFFNGEAPNGMEMTFVNEMQQNFMERAKKLVGNNVALTMEDLKLVAFNAVIENMLQTYRKKGYDIDQDVEAYNMIALYKLGQVICGLPDSTVEDSDATYKLADQAYFTAQQMDVELSCMSDEI